MAAIRLSGFVLVLLLGALARPVAAQPPAAGQPMEAPLPSQTVTLPGPEGITLRAELILPPGQARGVPVIALHGCSGIGAPDRPIRLSRRERDWARRLAILGHPVLFPDSYGSRGFSAVCRGGDAQAMPETRRRADVHAAAAWAVQQPWSAGPGAGVFLLGWSHGGSTVIAATNAPVPPALIRAAIAFYPGCYRIGRKAAAWTPAVPVLMLLGAEDDWTPARFCQALVARMPAGAGPVEVVVYPGAVHGFDAPDQPVITLSGLANPRDGRARIGTEPAARADVLARVPAFLARHGGTRP